jgi:hypothetical protein
MIESSWRLGRTRLRDLGELGPVARVRRLAHPLPSPLRREELLHREDGSSREHIKHRAPNFVGEDRQSLAFAVFLLDPRQDLLAVLRMAQEQDGGLRECPLQMHVAHLRAARAEFLAGGLMHAFDQARVGRKFLHAIKPRHVMNLVEDRQRQDVPDAWDRPQPVERIGIVALRLPHDRQFEVHDEGVVLFDERQVDLDTFPDTRIG